jgi:hypothetical protein
MKSALVKREDDDGCLGKLTTQLAAIKEEVGRVAVGHSSTPFLLNVMVLCFSKTVLYGVI